MRPKSGLSVLKAQPLRRSAVGVWTAEVISRMLSAPSTLGGQEARLHILSTQGVCLNKICDQAGHWPPLGGL